VAVAALLLVPLLTMLLVRFLPARMLGGTQLGGATLTLLLALATAIAAIDAPIDHSPLYVDALSGLLLAVVALVGWLGAAYAIGYTQHDVAARRITAGQVRWFYIWYHLFVLTMLAVLVTDNLGLMWAAIEATTLASAILVGFYRTREALEAAWKYLILCTVGISFALFGVLLLSAAGIQAGLLGDAALSWRELRAAGAALDPQMVRLAFLFILVGFGTKVGFAPLHTWLPDAHSQAPTPVSAVLSGVLLPCAIYGIVRAQGIAAAAGSGGLASALLIGAGLLSILIAIPFILVQHDLKRLLAYSSIEHMGIIAVAVGIGGPVALYGGLLHLILHAIGKAVLFISAGAIVERFGTRELTRIVGAARAMPLTGMALLIAGLALTGIPPSGLFVSEFTIVAGGFRGGYALATGLLVAGIALAAVGITFHFGRAVLGEGRGVRTGRESHGQRLLVGVPLLALIVAGLWLPPPLAEAIERAVRDSGLPL